MRGSILLFAFVAAVVGMATAASAGTPMHAPALGARTITAVHNGVTTTTTLDPAVQMLGPAGSGNCANGSIWRQTWSQSSHSLLGGIVWTNQQTGAYYFGCGGNGRQPWVWQSPQFGWDTSGYHACDSGGHGFGVTITRQGCWKTGDPSQAYLRDYDQFTVSLVAKGLPFSQTYTMCAAFDPFDNMFGC